MKSLKQIQKDSTSKSQTSKRERRKKFNKWVNMDMYRHSSKKQNYYGGYGEKPDYYCDGCKERIYKAKVLNGKMWCDDCLSKGKHVNEKP